MDKLKRNLTIIALVYILLLGIYLAKFDFNPSATIQFSQNSLKIFKGQVPENIIRFSHSGFDGQYYYMMALEPELDSLRVSPHFFQRFLYPRLARMISLGITNLIPFILILINFIAIIIGSYFLMKILKHYDSNINLVFIYAFTVGLLISILKDLPECLMMTFAIISFYYAIKEKHKTAAIFLALSLLTRETAIIFWASIIVYYLIKRQWKTAIIYSLSIIPFLIWEAILTIHFGPIPFRAAFWSISWMKPLSGLLQYLSTKPVQIGELIQNVTPLENQTVYQMKNYALAESRLLNKQFSSLVVILFALIQLFIMIKIYLKDRKLTLFNISLLFQIIFILSLTNVLYGSHGIDAIGRYSLGMVLLSVLYFGEKKINYSRFLLVISTALTIIYTLIMLFIKPD